jgi:hypothetical protein
MQRAEIDRILAQLPNGDYHWPEFTMYIDASGVVMIGRSIAGCRYNRATGEAVGSLMSLWLAVHRVWLGDFGKMETGD